ncbi:MAG: fructosamine kinase family protein, partial [Gemmatimonadota bacterium]
INPSARLEGKNGESYFLKWNPSAPAEMFGAEADGLMALAAPRALRVPEVLGRGGSGTIPDPAWLLLEFIPQGRPGPDYGRRLGQGLAELHAFALTSPDPGAGAAYGWHRNNFIGSLPQGNDPSDDWVTFWRDRRLEPQLRMARDRGHFRGGGGGLLDNLLARLDEVMAGTEGEDPAFLHGDLWSGNFFPGPAGEPVLIDPAVYRGAGEVDLAMMELFGSFPVGFREGYESRRKLAPEYESFRRDLYQLYYLLVHVNLFGGSYARASLTAAERALRGA